MATFSKTLGANCSKTKPAMWIWVFCRHHWSFAFGTTFACSAIQSLTRSTRRAIPFASILWAILQFLENTCSDTLNISYNTRLNANCFRLAWHISGETRRGGNSEEGRLPFAPPFCAIHQQMLLPLLPLQPMCAAIFWHHSLHTPAICEFVWFVSINIKIFSEWFIFAGKIKFIRTFPARRTFQRDFERSAEGCGTRKAAICATKCWSEWQFQFATNGRQHWDCCCSRRNHKTRRKCGK